MRPLRPLSWRPELLVDDHAHWLVDPATQTQVGLPGPLAKERCVFALPLNGTGPVQIKPLEFVRDDDSRQVADPGRVVVGFDGLWIPRLLYARWTEDTRRL